MPPTTPKLLQGCAVGGVCIDLARAETLALLGSGQSALLRTVAQHLTTNSGLTVSFVDGAEALPSDRTVAQNLALGLPPEHPDAEAIVNRWLHVLGLSGVSPLAPSALGLEAQRRIALGRALAGSPDVLLLDDPFRGCDPDERRRLGEALRLLQRHNGMAMILATRHAPDARGIADRVMVLCAGLLRQEGETIAVYERPANAFAARALGEVNFLPGVLDAVEDDVALVTLATGVRVEGLLADATIGAACLIAVRPERIAVAAVAADEMGEGAVPARVETCAHYGDHLRLGLSIGAARIVVRRPPGPPPQIGAEVSIAWQMTHAHAVGVDAGG
jgi:ABC-type Fe3+/spermidine/putrescine transport system ATPase subunit